MRAAAVAAPRRASRCLATSNPAQPRADPAAERGFWENARLLGEGDTRSRVVGR
jgi:hypothetical protein